MLTLQVDISAVVDEQLDAAEVAHGAGVVKGGVLMRVDEVDVGIGELKQIHDLRGFAKFSRVEEKRPVGGGGGGGGHGGGRMRECGNIVNGHEWYREKGGTVLVSWIALEDD